VRGLGYEKQDVISKFLNNTKYSKFFEKKLILKEEEILEIVTRFERTINKKSDVSGKDKSIITKIIKRFIRHGFRSRAENYIINSVFILSAYFGCRDVCFNLNKNLSYFKPYVYLQEKYPKKHLKKLKPKITFTKFMLSERKRISHCSKLVYAAICRKQYLHLCDLKTAIFLEIYKIAICPETSLTFKNFVGLSRARLKFRRKRYNTKFKPRERPLDIAKLL
jgi:hypothetical protein